MTSRTHRTPRSKLARPASPGVPPAAPSARTAQRFSTANLFRAAVLDFTGFRESPRNPTGLDAAWRQTRTLHSGPGVLVHTPLLWNDDADARAAWLDRHLAPDAVLAVRSYSWGAGWGATRLCQSLERRGRRVDHLIMVDPVYRSPLLSMSWRSLVNRLPGLTPTIYLPDNVVEATVFAQRNDKPRAHRVVLNGSEVDPVVIPDATHRTIDDHPAVLAATLDIIAQELSE